MIDLIKLGEYLSDNSLDNFARKISDNDLIIHIVYNGEIFKFEEIIKKDDLNLNNYLCDKSIFNEELYISTEQNIKIPNSTDLAGLSPFLLRLGNKKPYNFSNKKDMDDLKKKLKSSLSNNNKKNSFTGELQKIYADYNKLVQVSTNPEDIENFFLSNDLENINNFIIEYFEFINNEIEIIISQILEYLDEKNIDKKSNFYLLCSCNNDFDLLNDIFYYYCKFLKIRKKTIKINYNEKCFFCGSKEVTYPSFSGYVIDENYYFFNYNFNKASNYHMKICRKCNSFMLLSEDILKSNKLPKNIMIIPKFRYDNDISNYDKFMKIINSNEKNFEKFNELLKDNFLDHFDLDLIIFKKEQQAFKVKRYVENYRSYLTRFEDLILINKDNTLNYLFDESISSNNKHKKNIKNIFDIEYVFKNFFSYIDYDGNTHELNIKYMYEIYFKDNITQDIDSNTSLLFLKYKDSFFDVIYELNINALNKQMINEIVYNCVYHYLRYNFTESMKFKNIICARLNEYFMIIKELLGINMLNKESVNKLKELFKNNESNLKDELLNMIQNDPYIKYYLLGQFIRHIDNYKNMHDVNTKVFSNYVSNVNRNNIKKLFVTEVLLKNEFYIKRMSKKSKIIFEIISYDLESLFNENELDFEDYMLILFSGYYTENILKSEN